MLAFLTKLKRRWSGASGQSLVIITLAMFMLITVAGYAIDFAAADAKHEQVQNATDAAALAAANCLASAGSSNSQCSSTTDTTDANAVATTIAAANGATISTPQYNTGTVTVQATGSLAGDMPFGVDSRNRVEKASAAASYNSVSQCANGDVGTDNCIAVFAGGTTCPAATSHWFGWYYTYNFGTGIDVTAAITSFDGALVSDSDVEVADAFGSNGGLFYGSGSNCEGWYPSWLSALGLWGDSTSGTQLPANLAYPRSWTAGTNSSGTTTLTPNTANTPLTCTYTVSNGAVSPSIPSASNFSYTVSGNNLTLTSLAISASIPAGVYCDPSGTITFAGVGFTGTSYASFYANTISGLTLGVNLSPCTSANNSSCPSSNNLLMYDTGTTTVTIGSALDHLNGTIYVPNATLEADSLGTSYGFLEAATVNITAALSLFGNGPEISSSGTLASSASLTG